MWKGIALGFALLGGAVAADSQVTRLALNEGWILQSEQGETIGPARIPGAVHDDLFRAGRIPDPFLGDHFLHLGHIDTASWRYSGQVILPLEARRAARAELVFDGIDTYAEIRINQVPVLRTDNMFRQWRLDLQPWQDRDTLDVEIRLFSAVQEGGRRAVAVPWTYPADSDPYPGKPSVFTRKAPYQFGWDFAPSMPGAAIWRPIWLEYGPATRLEGVWLQTREADTAMALLALHGEVLLPEADTVRLSWQLDAHAGDTLLWLPAGRHAVSLPVELPRPRLWWPRTHGTPYRYTLKMRLHNSTARDSAEQQVGLRTIRLDRRPDGWGTAFRFIVNGQPLFIQGANWVPADMFPGRINEARYRQLLHLAAGAEVNMLRVWGGGIYESDLFYGLADSLGILVWQDFIFAGTMYPGDEAFLANIKEEARQQVRRLREHPSLALWCGNNEIAVAWKNWGWSQTYGYAADLQDSLWADYLRVFEGLLPAMVADQHPGMDYLSSSPVSNWGDPRDLDHGNNHFWGVWHGEMALDSLTTRIPRFMAEYGMPSYPTRETLEQITTASQRQGTHPALAGRQRSYKGNGLLDRYIQAEMGELPADLLDWAEAGHQVQARALDRAIRAHRAGWPRCAGTLLWQWNEPWPGCSWAVIDYYGRPKPAYQAVRQAYRQPIPDGPEKED